MSNLPSRFNGGSDVSRVHGYGRPPARIERATREAVAVEHGRALVHNARVRATEYVAHQALSAVESLSNYEALAASTTPHAAGRYRAIVDTATVCLAQIVAETGRG